MSSGRASNCSVGVPVDLYWYDCADPRRHFEAAMEALQQAVMHPDRLWNPWTFAMAKKEFEARLREAQAGNLKPVDEVKEIGEGEVLFEIRWQDISTAERDPSVAGGVRHIKIAVRFLHAEPGELSLCFVGLHAHEKAIIAGDDEATRASQDAEIATALERYAEAARRGWSLN